MVFSNVFKMIMVLERRSEGRKASPKAEDFFKVGSKDEDEEMKDASQTDQSNDTIELEEIDLLNIGIDLFNSKDFEILQIARFTTLSSYAQQISVNEGFTKFLMTNSDRSLRLYEINYGSISQRKKGIFLLNEFSDVINKKKWTNAYFVKLGPNQRLESKAQGISGISGYQ